MELYYNSEIYALLCAEAGENIMIKKLMLKMIVQADDSLIEEILSAAMARKQELHPDWEIRYLAQPKSEDAQQRYERAWRVLTGEE